MSALRLYLNTPLLKISSEQISAIQNAEDIYDFFHDEDELYGDLFFCFSYLMKRGLKELFETFKGNEKIIINYKIRYNNN